VYYIIFILLYFGSTCLYDFLFKAKIKDPFQKYCKLSCILARKLSIDDKFLERVESSRQFRKALLVNY